MIKEAYDAGSDLCLEKIAISKKHIMGKAHGVLAQRVQDPLKFNWLKEQLATIKPRLQAKPTYTDELFAEKRVFPKRNTNRDAAISKAQALDYLDDINAVYPRGENFTQDQLEKRIAARIDMKRLSDYVPGTAGERRHKPQYAKAEVDPRDFGVTSFPRQETAGPGKGISPKVTIPLAALGLGGAGYAGYRMAKGKDKPEGPRYYHEQLLR